MQAYALDSPHGDNATVTVDLWRKHLRLSVVPQWRGAVKVNLQNRKEQRDTARYSCAQRHAFVDAPRAQPKYLPANILKEVVVDMITAVLFFWKEFITMRCFVI